MSWVTSLHVFCLEGIWRSVSGNCVITETRLFGNDAIAHFGVFSENHLCVLCIMYVLYSPLVCSPCMRRRAQASVFADLQSSCITSYTISHTHSLRLTFTLHQRWKSILLQLASSTRFLSGPKSFWSKTNHSSVVASLKLTKDLLWCQPLTFCSKAMSSVTLDKTLFHWFELDLHECCRALSPPPRGEGGRGYRAKQQPASDVLSPTFPR